MDIETLDTPSSSSLSFDKVNLQNIHSETQQPQDSDIIQGLPQRVLITIQKLDDLEFERALPLALQVVIKGKIELPVDISQLTRKIMSQYVKLSKAFKKTSDFQKLQRLLFLISVLAEMVRQDSKLELPFTQDFLGELFELDVQEIPLESQSRVLAVLGVVYSNLGQQSSLIRQFKIGKKLKEAILAGYPLATEIFTIKLFNKVILGLQLKGLAQFTLLELERYGIKKALLKTLGEKKVEQIEKYLQKLFPRKQSLGRS